MIRYFFESHAPMLGEVYLEIRLQSRASPGRRPEHSNCGSAPSFPLPPRSRHSESFRAVPSRLPPHHKSAASLPQGSSRPRSAARTRACPRGTPTARRSGTKTTSAGRCASARRGFGLGAERGRLRRCVRERGSLRSARLGSWTGPRGRASHPCRLAGCSARGGKRA